MPDAHEPTIPPSRPSPGLKVATLGGVPIYIGRTWPVIAIIIVATFGPSISRSRPDLGIRAYLVAAAFSVLLLLSVLAHEAAHAVVATRFGYRVNRVVADLWGGHTAYDTAQSRPGPSALVAVVGPAANGAIALAGWLLADQVPAGVPALLVGAIVWTNGFVALFNLLPGLPLDGGFLVDALVWRVTGNRDLGLIAAGWCGRVVTLLVLAWALLLPFLRGYPPSLFTVVWAGVIGAFLWGGATNAIRTGRARSALAGITIGSVWRRASSLPVASSVADAWALRASGLGGTAVIVVGEDGTALGLVDDDALLGIPEDARPVTPVMAAVRQQPDGWVVDAEPDAAVTPVVETMQTLQVGAVPVRPRSGRIEGIVLAGDLEAALSRGAAART
jgi:Zn-dependent protease/CBS domain-containing protein